MDKDKILLKNKALSILWIAFITAIFTYAFVALYIIKLEFKPFELSRLLQSLFAIGMINLIIGQVLFKKIPKSLKKIFKGDLEDLYNNFMTLNLIAWVFIESGAVFGLAISIIANSFTPYLYLGLPSLICLLISSPNPRVLKYIVK